LDAKLNIYWNNIARAKQHNLPFGPFYYLILTTAFPFPVNNFLYIFNFFFGQTITSLSEVFLRAFFPTFFNVVDFTVIFLSFLQPANAFLAISVTLNLCPFILTNFGTVIQGYRDC